jgi:uncharacterized protein (DUF302 family)
MRRAFLSLLLLPVITMAMAPGVTTYKSAFNVSTTLDRLSELATSKGLKIFARIDFAHDARAAGLALRDEQLLVFGNPNAGTALLQAAPVSGLDLPLKALAYADADGTTWIAFNEPGYIVSRHGIAPELEANIRGAVALIRAAAGVPPPAAATPP